MAASAITRSCQEADRSTHQDSNKMDLAMLKPVLAIFLGAALGALLRWQLGIKLNNLFPSLPPGTLTANLTGGYIIGIAIAYFGTAPHISPEWRLFIITGLCGGLTTFSTFSAEVVVLLNERRLFLGHESHCYACHRLIGNDIGGNRQ